MNIFSSINYILIYKKIELLSNTESDADLLQTVSFFIDKPGLDILIIFKKLKHLFLMTFKFSHA